MSEEPNLDTVKRIYAAFGNGDEDGFLEELTEDVSFELPRLEGLPLDSRYDGKDGIRKFLNDRKPALKYEAFDVQEFLSNEDTVVVLGETRGRAIPTGKPFRHEWVQVFRFRDGKVAAIKEFVSCEEISMAFR